MSPKRESGSSPGTSPTWTTALDEYTRQLAAKDQEETGKTARSMARRDGEGDGNEKLEKKSY